MTGSLLLLLMLVWPVAAQSQPAPLAWRIQQSSTSSRPFVGQVVQVQITVVPPAGHQQAATSPLPKVSAPWLAADWNWLLSPHEWACALSRRSDGLHVQWNGFPGTIRLPRRTGGDDGQAFIATVAFVAQPDALGRDKLVLRPATLTIGQQVISSNELVLQLRDPPRPPLDLTTFDLGIGKKSVTAAVAPEQLVVDQEALLTLTVTGEGTLQNMSRPTLGELYRFLPKEDWLLDYAPTTWTDQSTLVWSYRIRPRRVGAVVMAPLRFRSFDVASERHVVATTEPLHVQVVPRPSRAVGASRIGPEDLASFDLSWREESWMDRWQGLARPTSLGAMAILFLPLTLRLARRAWRSFRSIGTRTLPGPSAAAREALSALRTVAPNHDVEALARVLRHFLDARFGLGQAEPTTADVAARLGQRSVPNSLVDEAVRLWQALLEARFGDGHVREFTLLTLQTDDLVRRLDRAA